MKAELNDVNSIFKDNHDVLCALNQNSQEIEAFIREQKLKKLLDTYPDEVKPFLADFDFEHDNIVWTDWNLNADESTCVSKDPSKLRCRLETYSSNGELISMRNIYPFVTDKVDMRRMYSDEKYRDEMNDNFERARKEYEDSLSPKKSSELDFLEQRLIDSMVDLYFKKRHWDARTRERTKEKYQHDLCAYLECYIENKHRSQRF